MYKKKNELIDKIGDIINKIDVYIDNLFLL